MELSVTQAGEQPARREAMSAATSPGTSLVVCLFVAQAAGVLGRAIDAAQTPSVQYSFLEAILGRTSYPRMTAPATRSTSLRWNHFLLDFDSSPAETDNEVGTRHVENTVDQIRKSMNLALIVVPTHPPRNSSRTEASTALRLIDNKGIEVHPLGALVSRNKTRSPRKTEEAIHNAEKLILDKMTSSRSNGKTSKPSKKGLALAVTLPPMSLSRKQRQPAVLLEDGEINGRVRVAVKPNFNVASEIRVDKGKDGSYSGNGDTEPVSADWTNEVRLENAIVARLVTTTGTVVTLMIVIAIIVFLFALVLSHLCLSCFPCVLCYCYDEL